MNLRAINLPDVHWKTHLPITNVSLSGRAAIQDLKISLFTKDYISLDMFKLTRRRDSQHSVLSTACQCCLAWRPRIQYILQLQSTCTVLCISSYHEPQGRSACWRRRGGRTTVGVGYTQGYHSGNLRACDPCPCTATASGYLRGSRFFWTSCFGRFYMFIQRLCYSFGSREPNGWSSTDWKRPKNLGKTFYEIRQLPWRLNSDFEVITEIEPNW